MVYAPLKEQKRKTLLRLEVVEFCSLSLSYEVMLGGKEESSVLIHVVVTDFTHNYF